ncbi:MAG: IS3 family transposase [Thermoanaerobaculia bacterium]|nr:IS3 family transposase [Thermoanaerobaculia bacterium]
MVSLIIDTWRQRRPSQRALEDEALRTQIQGIHRKSRGTYGSPRVRDELLAQAVSIGRRRVARLMREQSLQGIPRRRRHRPSASDPGRSAAPNLLDRDFSTSGPDQVWVADITYLWSGAQWVYLAVVLDLYSRRVVGWELSKTADTSLVHSALQMALLARRPTRLLHHSDRGCQYTSRAYRRALDEAGIQVSMSRKGDCWDNAVAESFFATLKRELAHRSSWENLGQVRQDVGDYIDGFYNRRRRHSSLAGRTPVDFETMQLPAN